MDLTGNNAWTATASIYVDAIEVITGTIFRTQPRHDDPCARPNGSSGQTVELHMKG